MLLEVADQGGAGVRAARTSERIDHHALGTLRVHLRRGEDPRHGQGRHERNGADDQ